MVVSHPHFSPPRPSRKNPGQEVSDSHPANPLTLPCSHQISKHAMVGPYCLIKKLGYGSSANVCLAIDSVTGLAVAVKMIPKTYLQFHPTERRAIRVDREVQILKSLNHPNITKFVDAFRTPEVDVIVTEYVPGKDLFWLMKRPQNQNGLLKARAFTFFYQILSAVEYCHNCGIVHRDIKLENILLDESTDTVKLTDFGLAAGLDPNSPHPMLETACGSPYYVAPEVFRGRKYEGKPVDVWSLGVLLYVLHAGRFPFDEESLPQLLVAISRAVYAIPPHFDGLLCGLIEQMLNPFHATRVSILEIKVHLWWIQNCLRFHLPLLGVQHPATSNPATGLCPIDEILSDKLALPCCSSQPTPRASSNLPRRFTQIPSVASSVISSSTCSTNGHSDSPSPSPSNRRGHIHTGSPFNRKVKVGEPTNPPACFLGRRRLQVEVEAIPDLNFLGLQQAQTKPKAKKGIKRVLMELRDAFRRRFSVAKDPN